MSKILSANGKWSIDESGNLTVKKVTADEIETKNGITTYDTETRELFCIKVTADVTMTVAGRCGKE